MRNQIRRHDEPHTERPIVASRTVEPATANIQRRSTDELITALADLEGRLRLFDSDPDGELGQPTRRSLVKAEYRILRELRRRETLVREGLCWTVFRPHRTSRNSDLSLHR